MGGVFGRGAVLALLVLVSAPVRAQDVTNESGADDEGSSVNGPPKRPTLVEVSEPTDFPQLRETQLVPTDHGVQTSPDSWAGDPDVETNPFPRIIREHLAQHRDFVQPFLDPAVYPEISAKIMTAGGMDRPTKTTALDQFVYASLYFFDIYAPLLNMRDNLFFSPNRLRMNLKLPFIIGNNVLTVFVGGNVPVDASWSQGSGVNTMLGYAVGSKVISFQVRAGYGYDQLIGQFDSPLASSFLGDAALSLFLGRHLSLIAQADARKLIGQNGATVRAFPGLRVFPLEQSTLSLGAGAMWWGDTNNVVGQYLGHLATRAAGGYVDVSYVFF